VDAGTWLNALSQVALLLIAVYVASSAVIGGACASLARLPIWLGLLLGVFVPVLGPLALLITALGRFRYRSTARGMMTDSGPLFSQRRRLRFRSITGAGGLAILGLVIIAAAATLLVRWFKFDSRIVPPMSVWAWGSGIDVFVICSVSVLLTAFGLSFFRPSRWAAILVASIGSWWLVLSGVCLVLTVPVTELLKQLGALSYTVGDLLLALKLHTSQAGFDLLPGVDLSSIGIVGTHVDLSTIDLAEPVPAATLELGGAFFIALVVGIFALTWSVFELAAIQRTHKPRSEN
jgi:hypothetical protein